MQASPKCVNTVESQPGDRSSGALRRPALDRASRVARLDLETPGAFALPILRDSQLQLSDPRDQKA
jgi:hypothetical protein